MNDRARPFLIWTNQRTGGTNFARALFERSPVVARHLAEAAEGRAWAWRARALDNAWQLHEPFNAQDETRMFGALTEEWRASGDAEALDAELGGILDRGLPIKHCVEMVPAELNDALARVSTARGYRHVLLHRRSALDRLLSLHFAENSGAWGRHFYSRDSIDDSMFGKSLPVEELVRHQHFCVERIQRAWEVLRRLDAWQALVTFEELYEAPLKEHAIATVMRLLRDLGLSGGEIDDRRFARELVSHGDQGSRAEYRRFAGHEALRDALRDVPDACFPQSAFRVLVDAPWQAGGEVVYAAVDRIPDVLQFRERFAVSGVVVTATGQSGATLELAGDAVPRKVHWGIRSPMMEQRFSGTDGAAFARFRDDRLECQPGTEPRIDLVRGENRIPLFRLRFERLTEPPVDEVA